jgi:hypothetical protein
MYLIMFNKIEIYRFVHRLVTHLEDRLKLT